MKKSDLEYFRNMYLNNKSYESEHQSIIEIENFICEWVGETYFENCNSLIPKMAMVYEILKDTFSYTGMIYKGIVVDSDMNILESNTITSCTNKLKVALKFSRAIDDYENYPLKINEINTEMKNIIISNHTNKNALNLSDLIFYISENTTNYDVSDHLMTYCVEEEIIYPMNINSNNCEVITKNYEIVIK